MLQRVVIIADVLISYSDLTNIDHPSTSGLLCSVLDINSGKSAKLNDTALQTASNSSNYLRYSKADFNLTDLGDSPPLVLPEPAADWGNFSLINLPGKNTFPVITTAMIVTASDLSQLGMFPSSEVLAFWLQRHCCT